jgi:hypothetical protein
MRSAISSTCSPYTAANRSTFAIRSSGVIRGQGPSSNALRAARTAASTSAGEPEGACAITSSVCGDTTSMRPSVAGSRHRPPTKSLSYEGIFMAPFALH